ncbi:outer membrane beta-barrel protein [Prevotella cerevisiae]|uniref:Outer membrane beta-barrel protein n=1 Tax=Segatella cerevisiae TaxID=2053716 RepID=A0ABT1BZX8_9BACT|nr:outer membrane beta-barrel family protein [Segatella cerevisiae]MCO6025888.1 outer membrane beta-barrel protein [Segatella cerevisiae]
MGQEIKGKITNTKGTAIPFANIVLLSSDSTFVTGTVSGEDGIFTINNVTTKTGILRISCIGYKNRFITQTIGNIGNIVLQEDATTLKEITVKGNTPTYKMTDGGLVTNVSGTMLGKVGTAEDVLKFVPGLRKTDNGYEVFGKGTPLIYLNGKKVRDLKELDRLSSGDIKDVTLVSNPGAEYDASAHAVLKIKTLSKSGDGFGIDYRQVFGLANKFFHEEQLDWNYRKGGLDLFGTLYYSQTNSKQKQTNHQMVQDGKALLLNTDLNIKSKSNYGNGVVGFNYDFGENHSIGATYTLDIPFVNRGWWESLSNVKIAEEQTELLKDNFTTKFKALPDHDITAYYSGLTGKVQIDWNGELYFTKTDNVQKSFETEQLHQDNRTVKTNNDNKSRLYATKIVASTPVWIGKLDVGSEFTRISRNSDYTVNGNNNLLPDDNNSRTTEWNMAGFSSFEMNINKVRLDAGLRFEHVSFKYYDHNVYKAEQSRKYNNLFPNVSIDFPIKHVDVDFAYTVKVSRPTYDMLSSNVQYNDRYTYQGGNPLLQPCQTHTAEFNITYHWIHFNGNWTYYHDSFYQYVKPYEKSSNITVFSFRNIPHYQSIYAGVTLSPKLAWWQPMFDFGVRKQFFHIKEDHTTTEYDHPIMFLTFNNIFQLPKDYMLNIDMDYQTGGHSTAIRWDSEGGVNVGIYKSLLKDRLTLNLQAKDIFNSYKTVNRLIYGDRNISNWKKADSRQLMLTIRYKINTTKSKYKGTGAGLEDKNRL